MIGYIVVRMVKIVKLCWYVLTSPWFNWWGRIRVCCLGCALHKPIGVRCVLYILCVPDISLSNSACFSNIWHLTCVTRKYIDAALVLFLSVTGQFWFCEVLYGVGTLVCCICPPGVVEIFRLLYLRLVNPWILLLLAGRSWFGKWSSSVIEWISLRWLSVALFERHYSSKASILWLLVSLL
jgi:hypothetical protein